jgi:Holliday junction resolvase
MKKEADVKKELKKYLTEIGAWQYWPVSNGMGRHGIPDVLICYRGHFLAIETKAPGRREEENGGCSALQVKEISSIRGAEGIAFSFDGEEDHWGHLKRAIKIIDVEGG